MSTLSFRAHCARNHDRVDFTDRAAFEAHMTGEHGAKKPHAGMAISPPSSWSNKKIAAPGWSVRGILPPRPHKAPPAPKNTEKLTAVLVKESAAETFYPTHLAADWHTDEKVRPTELRPGDTFTHEGHTYTLLQTEPDGRGHLLRHEGEGREGWVSEYKHKSVLKAGEPVYTVTIVKRAA